MKATAEIFKALGFIKEPSEIIEGYYCYYFKQWRGISFACKPGDEPTVEEVMERLKAYWKQCGRNEIKGTLRSLIELEDRV